MYARLNTDLSFLQRQQMVKEAFKIVPFLGEVPNRNLLAMILGRSRAAQTIKGPLVNATTLVKLDKARRGAVAPDAPDFGEVPLSQPLDFGRKLFLDPQVEDVDTIQDKIMRAAQSLKRKKSSEQRVDPNDPNSPMRGTPQRMTEAEVLAHNTEARRLREHLELLKSQPTRAARKGLQSEFRDTSEQIKELMGKVRKGEGYAADIPLRDIRDYLLQEAETRARARGAGDFEVQLARQAATQQLDEFVANSNKSMPVGPNQPRLTMNSNLRQFQDRLVNSASYTRQQRHDAIDATRSGVGKWLGRALRFGFERDMPSSEVTNRLLGNMEFDDLIDPRAQHRHGLVPARAVLGNPNKDAISVMRGLGTRASHAATEVLRLGGGLLDRIGDVAHKKVIAPAAEAGERFYNYLLSDKATRDAQQSLAKTRDSALEFTTGAARATADAARNVAQPLAIAAALRGLPLTPPVDERLVPNVPATSEIARGSIAPTPVPVDVPVKSNTAQRAYERSLRMRR